MFALPQLGLLGHDSGITTRKSFPARPARGSALTPGLLCNSPRCLSKPAWPWVRCFTDAFACISALSHAPRPDGPGKKDRAGTRAATKIHDACNTRPGGCSYTKPNNGPHPGSSPQKSHNHRHACGSSSCRPAPNPDASGDTRLLTPQTEAGHPRRTPCGNSGTTQDCTNHNPKQNPKKRCQRVVTKHICSITAGRVTCVGRASSWNPRAAKT